VTPYEVKFNWGDGNTNNYIIADVDSVITPQHKYSEENVYQIIAAVTDFMGTKVSSQPFEVKVLIDNSAPSNQCDPEVVKKIYFSKTYVIPREMIKICCF